MLLRYDRKVNKAHAHWYLTDFKFKHMHNYVPVLSMQSDFKTN